MSHLDHGQGERKVNDEKRLRVVETIRNAMEEANNRPGRTKGHLPASGEPLSTLSISVKGNGANEIAGRDFYDQSVRIERVLPPPIIVKTGDGVLDAKQKAKLTRLVQDVVDDSVVKQEPRTHRSIWFQLNRHMKVNSYHEIKQEDFEEAVKFLRRKSAIFRSLKSARKKNPEWRNKQYAAIHARCHQLGIDVWLNEYTEKTYGTTHLSALSDDDLEALYQKVMHKKIGRDCRSEGED
jgi:hypothetical protein